MLVLQVDWGVIGDQREHINMTSMTALAVLVGADYVELHHRKKGTRVSNHLGTYIYIYTHPLERNPTMNLMNLATPVPCQPMNP